MQLMQTVVKILEYSKNQAMESHQLVVLISDGRFDVSDGLKQALRECSGKNIFVVFIVIDNPKNKYSIVELPVNN